MAVTSDGRLWGWGGNSFGRFGVDEGIIFVSYSTPVYIMDQVVRAYISGTYSVAIRADGSLWAWGGGYIVDEWLPDVGDAVRIDTSVPTMIINGNVHSAYVPSPGRLLILKNDGTLWSWYFTDDEPELIMENVRLPQR